MRQHLSIRHLSGALATILILILGMGPSAAALPAGLLTSAVASGWTGKVDESRLPACCRRNGKHHCAMNSGSAEDRLQALSHETTVSAQESCPCLPHTLVSTPPTAAVVATDVDRFSLRIVCSPVSLCKLAPATVREQRNWPKRGPPATQIL